MGYPYLIGLPSKGVLLWDIIPSYWLLMCFFGGAQNGKLHKMLGGWIMNPGTPREPNTP